MHQDGLQHIVSSFSGSAEEAKHLICDELVVENVRSVEHQRQNISAVAKRALPLACTSLLDIALDPVSGNFTIFLHSSSITANREQVSGMRVKPVGWMSRTLDEAISDLVDNNEDGAFDVELFWRPFSILVFALQLDQGVTKILTKAYVDNIARQDITELRCHVNLV